MANPFPLNITEKEDSFEKEMLLANVDPRFKYTAEEFNKILAALRYLYLNSTGGRQTIKGTTDPNITPPDEYFLGDFYEWTQLGIFKGYYLYNGLKWILIDDQEIFDLAEEIVTADNKPIPQDADRIGVWNSFTGLLANYSVGQLVDYIKTKVSVTWESLTGNQKTVNLLGFEDGEAFRWSSDTGITGLASGDYFNNYYQDVSNPLRLYGAIFNNNVFKSFYESLDEGASWQSYASDSREPIVTGFDGVKITRDYSVSPYILLRSTDNGVTWSEVGIRREYSLIDTDKQGNWVCYYIGGFATSTDNGLTWANKTNASFNSLRRLGTDNNGVWIAFRQGTYLRSTDLFTTFTEIDIDPISQTTIGYSLAIKGDVWMITSVQFNQYIYVSKDKGLTFNRSQIGLFCDQISTDNNGTWVAIGSTGSGSLGYPSTRVSRNNGDTWDIVYSEVQLTRMFFFPSGNIIGLNVSQKKRVIGVPGIRFENIVNEYQESDGTPIPIVGKVLKLPESNSGIATDKGAFNSELDLSNINCNYYDDIDIASYGSIDFSIKEGAVTLGYVYFKVKSNGTTPLISNENLNTFFRERNGVPEDNILPSGYWNVYIWKLPLGDDLAIGVSEYKIYEDTSEGLPFFTDAVFYFNRTLDPAILDANGVREIVNRVDILNNPKNTTSTQKPLDDDINKTVNFYRSTPSGSATRSSRLDMNNISFSRGACTVIYVIDFGQISNIANGTALNLYTDVTTGSNCVMSTNQVSGKNNAINFRGFGFNNNPINFFGFGYDDIFYGKMMIALISDSVSGTLKIHVRSLHFTDSQSKTDTTSRPPESFSINHIGIISGSSDFKINSISVLNKVSNDADVNSLFDFLQTKFPL